MTVALRKPMTLPQFLAWEEQQELRYEFDGFRPVAMTGGTLRHEAIGNRLRAQLLSKLERKQCRPWGPTTKIEVQGRIRYPDAFVSCTPGAPHDTIVAEPVIVFEILSTGTSRTDRIEKLQEYQATESIHGAAWTAGAHTRDDVLQMLGIGIEMVLADIYADAELETEETGDREQDR